MLPATKNNTKKHNTKKRVIRVSARPPRWLGWLIIGTVVVTTLIALISTWQHKLRQYDQPIAESRQGRLVSYPGRNIAYATHFNHLNEKHLKAAKANGLPAPPKNSKEVEQMRGRLVKISTCKNYKVDDLSHSLPYLTKGAARSLDAIAADFADILERNNLPHYRFIVTSVLRTQESVQQLRKSGNINASENSAHCYATTFDITYKRFDKADPSPDYMTEENLKLVLGQALLNAQRAGLVYVKYEYKQACFHITSRQ